ncbi:metalloprotease [Haladaptatus sp. F3-133]|jgi:Zn-dependent protease|uniref:Metalloprotease n=1 Tax=Halorutilus salinus TaxID=2487751 RepID=A0A9Q4C5T2_9EURY|nr:metalloprotease [Halorutilus salinus]MCX2818919.1 metalloprotease [Halorutilus salinus]
MRLSTSRTETRDLGLAWLALTLGFTLLLTDLGSIARGFNADAFVGTFVAAFGTAGAGFLLHELAHKLVAQRYGYPAEFRADYEMLAVTIASGALGFLFAAPGAVHVRGRVDDRTNGVVALAGPATNLALFALFVPVSLVAGDGFIGYAASLGVFVNALLAAFNLAPYGPLDGRKVLAWNRRVYAVVLVVAVAVAAYSFLSL